MLALYWGAYSPTTRGVTVSEVSQSPRGVAFLIGTGKLKPGEILPSVRTVARQLKIHHNTVSHGIPRRCGQDAAGSMAWEPYKPSSPALFIMEEGYRAAASTALYTP
jgi:hypothetical protein